MLLYFACLTRERVVVGILLQEKLDPNVVNLKEETPLAVALQKDVVR